MTMLQDKMVTTRKVHPCVWCNETIQSGAQVRHRAYPWEDYIVSEWWHPECWGAMAQVPYDELEEGFFPGDYARGGTEYRG